MPKSENQKLKLLYVRKLLWDATNENHTLTVNEIILRLAALGIKAERKSIYDDIVDLQKFGMDIECRRGRSNEYFLASREFALPELKILADVVATSKFITRKKSIKLIKKLEHLTCTYNAKELQRRVQVRNRIENMHASVYSAVDKIHKAIAIKKKVAFNYWEWILEKKEKVRRNTGKFVVNPCVLCWDNDKYYLAVYSNETRDFKYYRVDKMSEVTILDKPCDFATMKQGLDLTIHTKKHFGMDAGKVQKVCLYCDNSLTGAMIDRFGQDLIIKKSDSLGFAISVDLVVNQLFFAWLVEFGTGIKILTPESVGKVFKDYLRNISKLY
ncbi:MAG: WYL domain-containing protein [Acidaminococcaceae bacterium]|nr:WYL domain-containing protein [Acidaminococcaceae bacterium]